MRSHTRTAFLAVATALASLALAGPAGATSREDSPRTSDQTVTCSVWEIVTHDCDIPECGNHEHLDTDGFWDVTYQCLSNCPNGPDADGNCSYADYD